MGTPPTFAITSSDAFPYGLAGDFEQPVKIEPRISSAVVARRLCQESDRRKNENAAELAVIEFCMNFICVLRAASAFTTRYLDCKPTRLEMARPSESPLHLGQVHSAEYLRTQNASIFYSDDFRRWHNYWLREAIDFHHCKKNWFCTSVGQIQDLSVKQILTVKGSQNLIWLRQERVADMEAHFDIVELLEFAVWCKVTHGTGPAGAN
jgi:hypothetical protein